jgi:hypothetical protein
MFLIGVSSGKIIQSILFEPELRSVRGSPEPNLFWFWALLVSGQNAGDVLNGSIRRNQKSKIKNQNGNSKFKINSPQANTLILHFTFLIFN